MRPAVLLLALAACAAAVGGGCGPQAAGDPELTVYLSAPMSGPRAADGEDVADGAQLAIEDAGGRVGDTAVTLATLDDAGEGGWDAPRSAANARLAAQDSTAIAYVGELDSGASRISIPITNEAGMLQVSPGSGAEDLTRAAIGSSDVPDTQPSGSRTFGRVIPSDRTQGQAAAVWMSDLGIDSVDVVAANGPFGAALVAGLEAIAAGPAVRGPGSEGGAAEASFDASADPLPAAGERVFPNPGAPLFASDALLGEGIGPTAASLRRFCALARSCGAEGRPPLRITSAALDPSQLPPGADGFLADFREAYGRRPGRYAAYGYEAMALVLDSIDRASDPLSRSSVIDAFFATSERDSILGTYSIDAVGNTTLGRLGAYEVAADLRPSPRSKPLRLP